MDTNCNLLLVKPEPIDETSDDNMEDGYIFESMSASILCKSELADEDDLVERVEVDEKAAPIPPIPMKNKFLVITDPDVLAAISQKEVEKKVKQPRKRKPRPKVKREKIDEEFPCIECPEKFKRKSDLTEHRRIHDLAMPFVCIDCEVRFASRPDLYKHNVRVHQKKTKTKTFSCTYCDAVFNKCYSLTEHTRTHTGDRPYECKTCGAKFSWKKCLKQHEFLHTGEKPHKCEQCGAAYRQRSHLVYHLRTHTGEKPFACDICAATFRHRGKLLNHKKLHSGERPYECPECKTRFLQLTALNNHMKCHPIKGQHTDHQCSVCEAKFIQKSILTRHMKCHSSERQFKYATAGGQFTLGGNLTLEEAKLAHYMDNYAPAVANFEVVDSDDLGEDELDEESDYDDQLELGEIKQIKIKVEKKDDGQGMSGHLVITGDD